MVTPNKREPNKHSVIVLVRRETSLIYAALIEREEERGRERERDGENYREGG